MTESTVGGGGVRRLTSRRRRTAPGDRGWALGLVAAVLLGLSWAGIGHGAPGDLTQPLGREGLRSALGRMTW